MSRATWRLGTRGSRLALAQAAIVERALAAAPLRATVEIVMVRTAGDRISAANPRGGFDATDGQFTAALEDALLAGEIDLAVHSLKDLPTAGHPELAIAAVPLRGDAADCVIGRDGGGLDALAPGATVGTSSARRDVQLRAIRPDLRLAPIRGNVDTRIGRVEKGEYDAVVLAAAGLDRLGRAAAPAARLSFDDVLPAPGQAALAIQVRADRRDLLDALRALDHGPTRTAVEAERRLLGLVGGGCLAPLGAYVELDADEIRLRAAYARDATAPLRRVDLHGHAAELPALLERAATQLVAGA